MPRVHVTQESKEPPPISYCLHSLEKIILANQRPHEVDAAELQRVSCCVFWRVLELITRNISVVGDGQRIERGHWSVPVGVGDNKSIIASFEKYEQRHYCRSSPSNPGNISRELIIPVVHGFPQPSRQRFYRFFPLALTGNPRASKKQKKGY